MIIWLSLLLQVPQMSIPQDWYRMVSLKSSLTASLPLPIFGELQSCEADPHSKCVPLRWFQPFPSFVSYRFSGPNGLSLCSPLSSLRRLLSWCPGSVQTGSYYSTSKRSSGSRGNELMQTSDIVKSSELFISRSSCIQASGWLTLPQRMIATEDVLNKYKWNQKDDITHAHVVGGMLSACLRHRGPW